MLRKLPSKFRLTNPQLSLKRRKTSKDCHLHLYLAWKLEHRQVGGVRKERDGFPKLRRNVDSMKQAGNVNAKKFSSHWLCDTSHTNARFGTICKLRALNELVSQPKDYNLDGRTRRLDSLITTWKLRLTEKYNRRNARKTEIRREQTLIDNVSVACRRILPRLST